MDDSPNATETSSEMLERMDPEDRRRLTELALDCLLASHLEARAFDPTYPSMATKAWEYGATKPEDMRKLYRLIMHRALEWSDRGGLPRRGTPPAEFLAAK